MWCNFFQKEEAPNLLKIVQFVCSVPVSNAFVERIFSVMGNVWTDERNRVAVNTLLVYADKPQTLDHLEDNVRRVIADKRPQMLEKVIENWTSRLDYIRASSGSPVPEIIFKM
ncbi:hypothetical protein TNCV_558551 [Trichonephila clavipes]|nr:hypothetical protein TNCV_558551 [Trichonephila clavipes]